MVILDVEPLVFTRHTWISVLSRFSKVGMYLLYLSLEERYKEHLRESSPIQVQSQLTGHQLSKGQLQYNRQGGAGYHKIN